MDLIMVGGVPARAAPSTRPAAEPRPTRPTPPERGAYRRWRAALRSIDRWVEGFRVVCRHEKHPSLLHRGVHRRASSEAIDNRYNR